MWSLTKLILIVVYSYSSFANKKDNTSQLRYLVSLRYKLKNCNVLHMTYHKASRATHSVLSRELFAFTNDLNFVYKIVQDLEQILEIRGPLKMVTDSESLLDFMTKGSAISQK